MYSRCLPLSRHTLCRTAPVCFTSVLTNHCGKYRPCRTRRECLRNRALGFMHQQQVQRQRFPCFISHTWSPLFCDVQHAVNAEFGLHKEQQSDAPADFLFLSCLHALTSRPAVVFDTQLAKTWQKKDWCSSWCLPRAPRAPPAWRSSSKCCRTRSSSSSGSCWRCPTSRR